MTYFLHTKIDIKVLSPVIYSNLKNLKYFYKLLLIYLNNTNFLIIKKIKKMKKIFYKLLNTVMKI